ncbi:glycosyltransferase [Algoriphagus sp. H41]|uniref:Glycosyltransferase n=1 Tax=Algoriphagus oliviformis TaxID=2811231 RepID=A0ABS3C776_9BACT|nr:glycosyltransferase [Algoriphagus oliviformis]MBN7812953.1 glycosyltransferase [Algoriphagus oliviformis]
MSVPTISLIIPCFNQGHFLRACLDSISRQTYPYWEALVVNDGSTDITSSVAADYIARDARFRYIEQPNLGLSGARNSGLEGVRGEFVLFLDADDWLEPKCLAVFVAAFHAQPDKLLYRCGYSYWDAPAGNKYHTHVPVANGAIFPGVLTSNLGPCHSILIRRDFAMCLGDFDTRLKSCEDWDFWIRAGRMGASIHSIPEVLVAYRYVANSMSRNPIVMYEALTEVSRRAGEADDRLPDSALHNKPTSLDYPSIQRKHLIVLLGVMLHQGRVEEAAKWYCREQAKWIWEVRDEDWKGLASYLSWGYFFGLLDIEALLRETYPLVCQFFGDIGYGVSKSKRLAKMAFDAQLKKRNHLLFGRYTGAALNRLGIFPL